MESYLIVTGLLYSVFAFSLATDNVKRWEKNMPSEYEVFASDVKRSRYLYLIVFLVSAVFAPMIIIEYVYNTILRKEV